MTEINVFVVEQLKNGFVLEYENINGDKVKEFFATKDELLEKIRDELY